MSREDILFYIAVIGAPAAILSCIYQIVQYHWPQPSKPMRATRQSKPSMRPVWFNAGIALVVCIAVGMDIYARNAPSATNDIPIRALLEYGIHPPATFRAEVDGAALQKYAQDYQAILITRVANPNIDIVTDDLLGISAPYSILNGRFEMAVTAPRLRWLPGQSGDLEFYVAVIPRGIRPDQIKTFADLGRLGGKLLDTGAMVAHAGTDVATPSIESSLRRQQGIAEGTQR
jgi:hypothetical protein